jgi:hypothetical protein
VPPFIGVPADEEHRGRLVNLMHENSDCVENFMDIVVKVSSLQQFVGK